MATSHVTEASFDSEVLGASGPVVVDFTAEWCPPCKAIAPSLDQIADELAGRVKIVKLDVDAEPGISARYGVRSMPTLMVFKNGEVVGQIVGAAPRAKIEALVTKALG